jgi:hypothetical protein
MGIMSFLVGKKSQTFSQADCMRVVSATGGDQASSVSAMDSSSYHASDHGAWVEYLRQPLRTYRKPGLTMQEEHALWTAARARSQSAAAATGSRVPASVS